MTSIQPEVNQEHDNEGSNSVQLNTDGGSVVHGNVNIRDGDFIGRDKNIYIGAIKIPKWVLSVVVLLIAIISAVTIYTAWQTSTVATRVKLPDVMGDGFGIAIASLSAKNTQGELIQPDFASSISGNIANYMNEQTKESFKPNCAWQVKTPLKSRR